jgi:hypothetical protein
MESLSITGALGRPVSTGLSLELSCVQILRSGIAIARSIMYYKGHAEDMGTVVATDKKITVPYGTFEKCLQIKDSRLALGDCRI